MDRYPITTTFLREQREVYAHDVERESKYMGSSYDSALAHLRAAEACLAEMEAR